MGIDTDLTALDPSLDRCTLWNEPALHHDGETLYLALRCLALGDGGRPDLERSSLEVFSTIPNGSIDTWVWRYVGRLAGHQDATALGGSGLTQIDFPDGALLAIVTPTPGRSDIVSSSTTASEGSRSPVSTHRPSPERTTAYQRFEQR